VRTCGASVVAALRARARGIHPLVFQSQATSHTVGDGLSALSRRTLDSREVDRCIRPIFPLDRLDAPSIPVDVSDQACGVDTQVLRRVAPHLVRSPLKERERAREVAVLK